METMSFPKLISVISQLTKAILHKLLRGVYIREVQYYQPSDIIGQ